MILEKIENAVARYHVLYLELPARALIPQKDYDEYFGNSLPGEEGSLLEVKAGDEVGRLLVQPGKVTDVTLFKRKS